MTALVRAWQRRAAAMGEHVLKNRVFTRLRRHYASVAKIRNMRKRAMYVCASSTRCKHSRLTRLGARVCMLASARRTCPQAERVRAKLRQGKGSARPRV